MKFDQVKFFGEKTVACVVAGVFHCFVQLAYIFHRKDFFSILIRFFSRAKVFKSVATKAFVRLNELALSFC